MVVNDDLVDDGVAWSRAEALVTGRCSSTMTLVIKSLDAARTRMTLEEKAERPLVIRGMASTFGDPPDTDNDVILPGAFTESLLWWKSNGWMPPMYWNHLWSNVIGKWTSIEQTDRGLEVTGELTPGHKLAEDVAASIRHGSARGLSIGLHIAQSHVRHDGVRVIEKLHLHEISVCSVPANLSARIADVASKSLDEFVALLRHVGFSSKEARAIASGGFAALVSSKDEEGASGESHDDAMLSLLKRLDARIDAILEAARRIEVAR